MAGMSILNMLKKGSEMPFDHDSEFMWQEDAACRFQPYTLFQIASLEDAIAEGLTESEIKDLNEANLTRAKEICNTCPVWDECYTSADPSDFDWTMRAGIMPTRLNLTLQGRPRKPKAVKGGFQKVVDITQPCLRGHFEWVERSDGHGHRCRGCRRDPNAKPRKEIETNHERPCPEGHFDWRLVQRAGRKDRYLCRPCDNAKALERVHRKKAAKSGTIPA